MGEGQHTLQLRDEAFYGFTCSKFKGCVKENCRCWFCGIWSLDEKAKQTNFLAAHVKEGLACGSPFPTGTLLLWVPEEARAVEGAEGEEYMETPLTHPVFFFLMETGRRIDQASCWKILRDATEGKNFLMFQCCLSSSCRNHRVSSEVEPVHWAMFSFNVERTGSKRQNVK